GPLDPSAQMVVTGFNEQETGRVWDSRPEVRITVAHNPYRLSEGRYWIEMHMLAGDAEFFQMQRGEIRGESYWVDYHDLGGLQPSVNVFGVREDLSLKLLCEVIDDYVLSIEGDWPGPVTIRWSR